MLRLSRPHRRVHKLSRVRIGRFAGRANKCTPRAVLGLTGEIVGPLAKGEGVLVVAGDDGYSVEPLE